MGRLILFTGGNIVVSNEWWALESRTNVTEINDGPTLSNYIVPDDITGYGIDFDCEGAL